MLCRYWCKRILGGNLTEGHHETFLERTTFICCDWIWDMPQLEVGSKWISSTDWTQGQSKLHHTLYMIVSIVNLRDSRMTWESGLLGMPLEDYLECSNWGGRPVASWDTCKWSKGAEQQHAFITLGFLTVDTCDSLLQVPATSTSLDWQSVPLNCEPHQMLP